MREQCRRWGNHPISVAVASNVAKPAIMKVLSTLGCQNIQAEVVVVDPDVPYPVNTLRNLALANVRTSHAVYIDADFLVSPNLYESLVRQRNKLQDHRDAIVVPALELHGLCKDCKELHLDITPASKSEAYELYGSSGEDTIVKQFDFKNHEGHATTNTEEWFHQKPNTLHKIECIRSERYEPYLAFRYCRDLPPFQEAFTGYGQNKITWVKHLVRVGYQFHRLADAFVIHFPHSKSKDFKTWKKNKASLGREALEVTRISNQFVDWMNKTVPNLQRVPFCTENTDIV